MRFHCVDGSIYVIQSAGTAKDYREQCHLRACHGLVNACDIGNTKLFNCLRSQRRSTSEVFFLRVSFTAAVLKRSCSIVFVHSSSFVQSGNRDVAFRGKRCTASCAVCKRRCSFSYACARFRQEQMGDLANSICECRGGEVPAQLRCARSRTGSAQLFRFSIHSGDPEADFFQRFSVTAAVHKRTLLEQRRLSNTEPPPAETLH